MTSMYLVYVRISGKGFSIHGSQRGDDDTGENDIGNVLGGK